MRTIDDAIKEKREAMMRLHGEIQVLERAKVLLNGTATHQTETPISSAGKSRGSKGRSHPLRGKTRPGSAVSQAVLVLEDAGVPLHIDEIVTRLKKRGVDTKKQSIGSTLAKMSKLGQTFFRADQPNTFGLLKWKARIMAGNDSGTGTFKLA